MLRKLFRSAILGLACAAIILVVFPHSFRTPLFLTENKVEGFSQAVRIASPAVVNVYNQSFSTSDNSQYEVNNLGSGVIMRKDGYILTNQHVIQNADQIVVALQDGRIFEASLVGSDSLTDLAVLKIRADDLAIIPQNPERQVHVGDIALAIGNPYNLGQSVSQGIISATGRNAVGDYVGRQDFIQTDASINRGNSGGALINSKGELVGISTLSIGKDAGNIAEGLNFAIPMNIANYVLEQIIKDGRVIRGFLGVQTDIYFNSGYNNTELQGIKITQVMPEGPAARAGIIAGDIVLKFNDEIVESPAQMMRSISQTRPNTTVVLEILRQNQRALISVVIDEYPLD